MKAIVFIVSAVIASVFVAGLGANAQVKISTDNSPPDNSAMLEVKSIDKGFLPPRMTHSQLNAISNPADGLVVYCIDCGSNGLGSLTIFMSGVWFTLSTNCLNPLSPVEGTHIPSGTQIVWNWNTVSYATGYKWNTINDYASAADLGTSTTKTETGLNCSTPYTRFVWAYNVCGYSIPADLTQSTVWACGCSITDSRDGKIYNTVQIGTQCWMEQNLNIGTRIQGNIGQTNNSIIEKHCYNDIEDSCTVYGGLYMWDEMMQYTTTPGVQGICPTGYHIPTTEEWLTMVTYLGGGTVAGGKLKEAGYRHWLTPNTGADNSSGFTAFGGGTHRYAPYNYFYLLMEAGIYWSSSLYAGVWPWRQNLDYNSAETSPYYCLKTESFSVRCLKD